MSDADHRRHRREAVTLVVEYDGADDLSADLTANLSEGGTFVRTARRLAVGTEVVLRLSFPGLVAPIRVPGVVRWTRDAGDDERGIGIEFVDGPGLSAELQPLLDRLRARDPNLVVPVVRVLVVEDNSHVARLIREGVAGGSRRAFGDDRAYHFDTAANGRDALDRLARTHYDLLVVDVYLPVMDGASLIAAVRADPKLARMPILAVSAGGDSARREALAAGADVFLDKPMRLRDIVASMRKLMPPPGTGSAGGPT
ncbi:MAG: TIGR02266 family protein [Deltaproteobacteria bacterium]|nr:MAG: TIGR02266 family protein [Deltaproteobacteria bacterium]